MKSEKSLIKRFMPLLIALLVFVLLMAVAAPVIAYYIRSAGKVEDEQTPAKPSNPSFTLDPENNTLTDVYISVPDQGYPVYVRVAIIVTWQKLADCECTTHRCTRKCTDCESCPDCEEDDCTECTEECTGCAGCDEDSGCKNCPDCEEDECIDCEDCDGCKGCGEVSDCGVCTDCENCEDREDCPRCNDDPDDDWDIVGAPEEGDDKDYTLQLGDGWEQNDKDELFYCKDPVLSGGTVPLLISSCSLLEDAKFPDIEGKSFRMNEDHRADHSGNRLYG